MNFNEVKELISIVDKSSLKSFEVAIDGCTIKMNKTGNAFEASQAQSAPAPTPAVSEAPSAVEDKPAENTAALAPAEDKGGNIVKAPLVGTFYASAGPGKPVYAPVGAKVKKGDVLCIIEAMKIMNEVVSDFDGEVKEVLAENEQLVEYGAPLFRIG